MSGTPTQIKFAVCHPEERHYSNGLCKPCAKRQWANNAYRTNAAHRERARKRRVVYSELQKEAVMNMYTNGEGTCRMCGQGDLDVLTLDHINDDGAAHRKRVFGKSRGAGVGAVFYRWVIKNDYPAGLQVLCHNCNWKKRAEYRRTHTYSKYN